YKKSATFRKNIWMLSGKLLDVFKKLLDVSGETLRCFPTIFSILLSFQPKNSLLRSKLEKMRKKHISQKGRFLYIMSEKAVFC
ncbi:MAG: hypothetical protein LBQ39_01170, partial [Tannerellaceae bacterium]|nr:hypothetical protein [Tannerellaceae bacterium]